MGSFIDKIILLRFKAWSFGVRNAQKLLNRISSKVGLSADSLFYKRMLFERREYFRNVKWTKERQKEFDQYWTTTYGSKIGSEWHRFYEALSGVYCVDYLPASVYLPDLAHKLNDAQMADLCGAKVMLSFFLDSPELENCIPKHYAYKIQGYYYDGNRSVLTCEELAERVANVGACVFKSSDGSQGRGVCMLDIKDGRDVKTGQSILELFQSTKGDFVLQERITEHSALSHLSPNSLNTIRITTYICQGKVYHAPIAIRFGVGDSFVDNLHAGGLGIGVQDDGTLLKTAWRIDSRHQGIAYTQNPNNGEPFEGYKIPYMDRVIDFTEKNHGRIPGMGMVSWDIVISEDGRPIVIEVNVSKQNPRFAQFLHCRPLFGDNTPKMLELVKK